MNGWEIWDLLTDMGRWKVGCILMGTVLELMRNAIMMTQMGEIIYSLPFRWVINGGILSLDYGNDYPLLEIYDVYVFGDELSGVLYVDGLRDGPITLYRY
ncbi:hypothetical protein [Bacteroides stercorirosoris]|uniref:hypothetical protein n=1 Tax=Bacteroides stercorirosoris TaxID=871324 RepID=UPI00216ACC46|nr:hypothetical protein [Bacteroides stercorirosoris]